MIDPDDPRWDMALAHHRETHHVWRCLEARMRLTRNEIFWGRSRHMVGVYIIADMIQADDRPR